MLALKVHTANPANERLVPREREKILSHTFFFLFPLVFSRFAKRNTLVGEGDGHAAKRNYISIYWY